MQHQKSNSLIALLVIIAPNLIRLATSSGFSGSFSAGFTRAPLFGTTTGGTRELAGSGSSKSYIRIEGDLMFGGLFPVHSAVSSRPTRGNSPMQQTTSRGPQSSSASVLPTTARTELSTDGNRGIDGQSSLLIESFSETDAYAQKNFSDKADAEPPGNLNQNAFYERMDPCGPLKDDVGIQRLEAMLCAVQYINQHTNILPAGNFDFLNS